MSDRAQILVVVATARELAVADGWRTLQCGVGPVDAEMATAAAISTHRPAAILHVGIAGARRSRALPPSSLVIGAEARYCDLNIAAEWAPTTVTASPLLLTAAQRVLPRSPQLVIGTSARVGGTIGLDAAVDVEAMEGLRSLANV